MEVGVEGRGRDERSEVEVSRVDRCCSTVSCQRQRDASCKSKQENSRCTEGTARWRRRKDDKTSEGRRGLMGEMVLISDGPPLVTSVPSLQSLGMVPVEHLHLKHVLQTVCVLESVILRSFGPEGGQVLFIRDTGQAMLSRSGARILAALRLEHPLARMVVECVSKHSIITGDGSKTFILLLASLLRMIHATACKESNVSQTYSSRDAAEAATARHLADELLVFALEKLGDLIAFGVVPYGCCLSCEDFTAKTQFPAQTNNHCVQTVLASFFRSRLGHTHCDFFSNLTCELLTQFKNNQPSSSLQFVNDNLPALHTPVSGFPISCSRLIEGQVIHRDFATPCPNTDHQPVKAVVFTGYLQRKLLSAGEVLELECGNIAQFNAWAERSLERVIANLQSLGISVLLSAVKQSAAVLALASQADMCIVECMSMWLSMIQRNDFPALFPWPVHILLSKRNAHGMVVLPFYDPGVFGSIYYDRKTVQSLRCLVPIFIILSAPAPIRIANHKGASNGATMAVLELWRTLGLQCTEQQPAVGFLVCKFLQHQCDHHTASVCLGCVKSHGEAFELHLSYARTCHSHGILLHGWLEESQCLSIWDAIQSARKNLRSSNIVHGCFSAALVRRMYSCECLVVGQSHYKTFDNKFFTFTGHCQYLLARDCGKDMTLSLPSLEDMTVKLKHGGVVSTSGQHHLLYTCLHCQRSLITLTRLAGIWIYPVSVWPASLAASVHLAQ
ncbi:Bardet-Biedl syndrome 10 protein -like protein [Collichthys lucidus]|uniref:Bardet-Biedl syndrome 10 protein-like protein n=1 Tax=Collichthys lucidus TaxID=240159 RepID=A0A4U5UFD8_COLLU|nr:Bardet-Biedl syndrome 10 protein -like protein [Collichthys lucidus]